MVWVITNTSFAPSWDVRRSLQSYMRYKPVWACLDAVVEVHKLADVFILQLSGVRVCWRGQEPQGVQLVCHPALHLRVRGNHVPAGCVP